MDGVCQPYCGLILKVAETLGYAGCVVLAFAFRVLFLNARVNFARVGLWDVVVLVRCP